MLSITMATNIDELFGNDIILVYPDRTPTQNLRHEYHSERFDTEGRKIDFEEVQRTLASLISDVDALHIEQIGQPMDTYNLRELLVPVQNKFWTDSRFESAFKLLGLPYEKRECVRIPWWNVIAGGELEHMVNSGGIQVKLGPRHSYETQLIRSGYQLPIKSVSVGGLILSDEGHLVVGLRGGKTLPNTYHINAGALRVTDGLKTGKQSIYDIFRLAELEPEFGIQDNDVKEATIHSRIMDYSIERGPMYNFLVRTNLSRAELKQRWERNPDEDKDEHQEIVFVPANPKDVNRFIREHYVGICENTLDRRENERHLLHPGALSLAAFSGMPISELRQLYREGLH